jgi:hypothetical protein
MPGAQHAVVGTAPLEEGFLDMDARISALRLEHKTVAGRHVITSPDVPGLFVAEATRELAEAGLPAALEMLERMRKRREAEAPAVA